MKTARKILFAMLLVVSLMSFSMVAHAIDKADAITIDSVMFDEYVGETGTVDNTLISVKTGFTAVYPSEQITILVSTEDITELSDSNVDKIIYIDQVDRPESGELDFVIEKARVASAIGSQTINGAKLYVKMGGTNVDTMAEEEVTLVDPAASKVVPGDANGDTKVDAVDGAYIQRHVVGWTIPNISVEAMDVNDANGVDAVDVALLLRYVAGWNNIVLK